MTAGKIQIIFIMTALLGPLGLWAAADSTNWQRAYLPQNDAWRQTEQHLVFNNDSEPESLDPHKASGVTALRLIQTLYEGLTCLDPRTLEPRPGVAASWSLADDGRLYTFLLRPDAKWSDGRPLTAADFVRSWQRALTPATACPYANLFWHIAGAQDYFQGKTTDFASVGVRAVDAQALQVRLTAPCHYFLDLTAFAAFMPVRTEIATQFAERWTHPEHVQTNGAFVLREWSPRRQIVLSANAHYWDRAVVKLATITALPLDDLNTAYQLFLQGKIHWLPSVPQAKIEEIRRHPDYYVTPYFGTYFYRFNVTRAPFQDARVRRAFCLATDKREITEFILKGGQIPVGSFCPPIAGYEPVTGLEYDPAAARRLLQEAGYSPETEPFPTIEIAYNTSEAHKLIAEALAQQWKRNLGVTVATRNLEWKVFMAETKALDYQICRSSWIGDYGDASSFFAIFTSTDGNNRTGWAFPEYDRLFEAAQRESDPARRQALFQRQETILTEEQCPILPLYRYVNQGMLAETVGGFHQNILDTHDLKYVWLEPR